MLTFSDAGYRLRIRLFCIIRSSGLNKYSDFRLGDAARSIGSGGSTSSGCGAGLGSGSGSIIKRFGDKEVLVFKALTNSVCRDWGRL